MSIRIADNEELGVLSLKLFLLIIASLREAREGVSSSIDFVLAIVNPKIILRKVLGLFDQIKAHTLHIHKLIKIVVVS